MKLKITSILFISLMITTSGIFAQAPQLFNYQAVLRNETGQALASQDVTVGIAILEVSSEGTEVFSEVHSTQTNEFGLVNLQIGSVNSLENINWAATDYFIEITVNGETMGASQLLSVPFALHALSSADAFSGDYNDLTNTPDLNDFIIAADPQNGDLLYFSDNQWNTIGVGQEGQILTIKDGIPQWVFMEQTIESVTDIEGNVYYTTSIGNQLWMTSNLRTSTYADGTPIPGDLTNAEWTATTEGAHAVYPHESVSGIDSEEQMVELYGKLYNYYAVMDQKGLCPAEWRVATRDDYDELNMYVAYWGKADEPNKDNSVAGNFLKSCRQINSPLGGDCDTSIHPRWESDNSNHGTNSFDFDGLPAGRRMGDGTFNNIGSRGYWWTSTELSYAMSYWRALWNDGGFLYSGYEYRVQGLSVRCIKE